MQLFRLQTEIQAPIPKTLILIKQHPRLSELCWVCTERQKHDNLEIAVWRNTCPFFVFVFDSHYSAWRKCVVESGSWLQELGSCTFPGKCHHTFFSATCLICSSDCCLLAGYPGAGSDWHQSPFPTSGIMNSYWAQPELRWRSQGGAEFKWPKCLGMGMRMWLWRALSSITAVHRLSWNISWACFWWRWCWCWQEPLQLWGAPWACSSQPVHPAAVGSDRLEIIFCVGICPRPQALSCSLAFDMPWFLCTRTEHLVFADTESYLSSCVLLCRAIRVSSSQGFWFLDNKLTNSTLQDYHFLLLFLEVLILKPWN